MIDKTAYLLPVPSSDDTLVKVGPRNLPSD